MQVEAGTLPICLLLGPVRLEQRWPPNLFLLRSFHSQGAVAICAVLAGNIPYTPSMWTTVQNCNTLVTRRKTCATLPPNQSSLSPPRRAPRADPAGTTGVPLAPAAFFAPRAPCAKREPCPHWSR